MPQKHHVLWHSEVLQTRSGPQVCAELWWGAAGSSAEDQGLRTKASTGSWIRKGAVYHETVLRQNASTWRWRISTLSQDNDIPQLSSDNASWETVAYRTSAWVCSNNVVNADEPQDPRCSRPSASGSRHSISLKGTGCSPGSLCVHLFLSVCLLLSPSYSLL